MIIPDNWAELLTPGLRFHFSQAMQDQEDTVRELYDVQKSTRAQETALETGSLGLMDLWDGSTSYEDFEKGFKTTWTHKKYSKGIQINREMLEDDQYTAIKDKVKELAEVASYTRQYYGASLFNNAFSGGAYALADGVALCSNSHPVLPGSATVNDNLFALTLDSDNLETIRTHMMTNWKDDKGKNILINPSKLALVVPPNLRKAALAIADSDKEPDVTDNNVNVWKGSIKVIEWNMLTDSNAWFVLELSRMKRLLKWFDRRALDFSNHIEFDTEVAKYRVINRFSFGAASWSWICGSNPS